METPAYLERLMREHSLSLQALAIEVGEMSLFEYFEENSRLLSTLKALGVQIILDDFGSGVFSSASLRDLPLDVLKIDARFIKGLEHDNECAVFVESMINMAKVYRARWWPKA